MICIEDYPLIEEAIQYAIKHVTVHTSDPKWTDEVRELAMCYVDGYMAASRAIAEYAAVIKIGIRNYIFL